MTTSPEDFARTVITSMEAARAVVNDHRGDIGDLVGQVVEEWIIIDRAPRICVGDLVDGVILAYAAALSSPDLTGDHKCPGVTFHVNANTTTKLILAKVYDQLPIAMTIDTGKEDVYVAPA